MASGVMRLQNWLASVAARPTDGEEDRAQKTAFVLMALLITGASVIWSIIYLFVGRPEAAAIPGGYVIVSLISVVVLAATRWFELFRVIQILLILVLPFLLNVTLGGFDQSSSVNIWAFLPIAGVLMFQRRSSVIWLIGYELLLVACAVFDTRIHELARPMSETIRDVFWVGNIGGLPAVVFLVLRYAFRRNAEILEEVRDQRQATERAMAKVAEQAGQLQELDRAKTLFFANVSHELRTPLTLLLGPLQSALQAGQLPEDVQRRLTLSARNGRRLLRQINMLLDFTKAESGKLDLDLRPENPAKLIAGLVEEVQPAAVARKIELAYDGPPSSPMMELDRERLEQAVLNLVGNAVKFTPEGGRIDVIVRIAGDRLVLEVKDSGIGISAEDIPRLFQSFAQARRPTGTSGAAMYRQEHQGTGLGLAITKRIVDLHGGRIDVESRVGQGTTFRVQIPLVYSRPAADADRAATVIEGAAQAAARAPRTELADLEFEAEEPTQQTARPLVEAADAAQDTRPRILLVDDHADVRRFLRDLLHESYRLLEASDGQQGIDVANRELPDLIISDVMMPKKSGFELLDELKGNHRTRGIPIMLLTARSGVEGTVEGLKRGADDYLAKPFDPKELSARVFSLLRLTGMERELAKMYALQKDELEAARVIQESLLPANSPAVPRLDVAGRILTASELGGDFYDFLPLGRANNGVSKKLGIAIGDVTGHGASSALVTAVAKAGLDTHANDRSQPADVLKHLGRVVFDSCKGKRLMTFFYGVIDTETSKFQYCNAGHMFPWVVNAEAGKVMPLTQTGAPLGAPLGVERLAEYQVHTVDLAAGDVLLLFSDGLVEAESKTGQAYGTRRLRQTLEKYRRLPAQQLVDALIEAVMLYTERSSPEDDITAVVARVRPEAA